MPTAGVSHSIVLDSLGYMTQGEFVRRPMRAFARKIGAGATKYSDQDTWRTEAWDDFSLGRGQEFEEKKGLFWDSDRVETRIKKQLTLAPLRITAAVGAGAAAMAGQPIKIFLADPGGTLKLHVVAGDETYSWDATNNYWTDLNCGVATTITDAAYYGGIVYVAQGTTAAAREWNGSGWAAVTNNWEADILGVGLVPYAGDKGSWALWRSNPDNKNQISYSLNGDTFSTAITVGDTASYVTWMGSFMGDLFVGKQDGLWVVGQDGKPSEVLPFWSQRDTNNFAASSVWHKNQLFMNVLSDLWRFDGNEVRSIGPNALTLPITEGLVWAQGGPGFATTKQGKFADLLPCTNWLLGAWDCGSNSSAYSLILAYNGIGWHEVQRTAAVNKRMRALAYTPAGIVEAESRLWFGEDTAVNYCLMPDYSDNPWAWASQSFAAQGYLETSWFDADLRKTTKDWGAVTIEADSIATGKTITVLYKVDNDVNWLGGTSGDWHTSTGADTTGTISSTTKNQATLYFPPSTYGYRIKFQIQFDTNAPTVSPRLTAFLLRYDIVSDNVYGFQFAIKCTNGSRLDGKPMGKKWQTQVTDFWTTAEKKEPVVLYDPQNTAWTVRIEDANQRYTYTKGGRVNGALIVCTAYQA
jgi:hypothetical protein